MIKWFSFIVGVACICGAVIICVVSQPYNVTASRMRGGEIVPNNVAKDTAFGLAISGGICIFGACVIESKRGILKSVSED